ncbi:MAG: hypothetical protein KDB94_10725, partial [Acidobacteria bacterium]|nr:hypothetical protein [Acidobacteriota bacterium]
MRLEGFGASRDGALRAKKKPPTLARRGFDRFVAKRDYIPAGGAAGAGAGAAFFFLGALFFLVAFF